MPIGVLSSYNKKFIAGFRIINVGVNVCTEEHL